MIRVRDIEDKGNHCSCCLDRERNENESLKEITFKTYGSEFTFCLCEKCLKELFKLSKQNITTKSKAIGAKGREMIDYSKR